MKVFSYLAQGVRDNMRPAMGGELGHAERPDTPIEILCKLPLKALAIYHLIGDEFRNVWEQSYFLSTLNLNFLMNLLRDWLRKNWYFH